MEVDGAPHYEEEGYAKDQRRTAYLKRYKMKVSRFENCEVFDHIDKVLDRIKSEFVRGVRRRDR